MGPITGVGLGSKCYRTEDVKIPVGEQKRISDRRVAACKPHGSHNVWLIASQRSGGQRVRYLILSRQGDQNADNQLYHDARFSDVPVITEQRILEICYQTFHIAPLNCLAIVLYLKYTTQWQGMQTNFYFFTRFLAFFRVL